MTRAGMDLAELRRLAEAATPGPWKARLENDMAEPWRVLAPNDGELAVIRWRVRDEGEPDAAYIAAANPATILALLDDPRTLRKALEQLHSAVCACPFDGTDSGCNLTLTGTELGAALAASPDPEGPDPE